MAPLKEPYRHLKRVKSERRSLTSLSAADLPTTQCDQENEQGTVLVLIAATLPEAECVRKSLPGALSVRDLIQVEVPKDEPTTVEDCRAWSSIWPVIYKRPSWRPFFYSNPTAVRTAIFERMECMKSISSSSSHSFCAEHCVLCLGQTLLAASGCQPDSPSPLTESENAVQHPLYHAVIVALGRLSRTIRHSKRTETDELLRATHASQRERTGRRHYTPGTLSGSSLKRPFPSESADVSGSLPNGYSGNGVTPEVVVSTSVTASETADKLFLSDEPMKSSQYYATGVVAYCSHEPCIMCSMALLHNRVAAVVFPQGRENFEHGGLGGRLSLHAQQQLNHRFHVLRVDLHDVPR